MHLTQILKNKGTIDKVLLDLTVQQSNGFLSIYDNLKYSYNILFKQIVKEEKNNGYFYQNIEKYQMLKQGFRYFGKKYKDEKAKVDKRLRNYQLSRINYEELGAYQQELTTKSHAISELSKTVSLDEIDDKDKVTTG